jgi:type VI secretion system protein ImpJ
MTQSLSAPQAQKVLGHEGMLLLPQHFQQADRHAAANLRRVLEQAQAHAHGFTRLTIDTEALARGQFRLLDAAGLLPDGLAFDIPSDDAAPLARPVVIPPTKDRLAVWLGAALERPGEANCSTQGARDGRATRWRAQAASLPDDAGDAERQDVQLATRHLLVVVDGEPVDGLSLLSLGA